MMPDHYCGSYLTLRSPESPAALFPSDQSASDFTASRTFSGFAYGGADSFLRWGAANEVLEFYAPSIDAPRQS